MIATIRNGRSFWYCRTRCSSTSCSRISIVILIFLRRKTMTQRRQSRTRPKRTAPRRKWTTTGYRTTKGKATKWCNWGRRRCDCM